MTITIVSADSAGNEGDSPSNSSRSGSVSSDGRYVAFISGASNLVADDTNLRSDVFVKDLQTGLITRVSTDAGGAQGNHDSYNPSISADGRYVAFWSYAHNLVAGDNNGTSDVFIKDLQTGGISRVSTDASGAQANDDSYNPLISADGRYVAFASSASNLVAEDTNGVEDVFVKDLQTGVITRVSTDAGGAQGNNISLTPSISANGRYVAFYSIASNLVADDTNGIFDVFIKDLQTGGISRVSTDASGSEANDDLG